MQIWPKALGSSQKREGHRTKSDGKCAIILNDREHERQRNKKPFTTNIL